MHALAHVFLTVLAPICLIAGLGYLAARTGLIADARPLSRVSMYIFLPTLTFSVLLKSSLEATEFIMLFLCAWCVGGLQALLGWSIARRFAFDRLTKSAFLLSIITVNAGNFGLPLNQFGFGTDSLVIATAYYIGLQTFVYTVGVFVASHGSQSLGPSLIQVFKMPLLYTSSAGLLLHWVGWTLPELVMRPVHLLGSAAVPTMLILLGIELARGRITHQHLPLGLATVLKLGAGPLIGLALTWMLGLHGLMRNVVIVQSALPTAVSAALLAVEFHVQPTLVSSVVLVTTVGSFFTLTLLLALLLA